MTPFTKKKDLKNNWYLVNADNVVVALDVVVCVVIGAVEAVVVKVVVVVVVVVAV